ncbi:hypothetical protein N7457_002647 [Penicillium paradoxum]|uniref:uncharacterized protein n=1 Tax=Penicillium paradoxum TaxID=176176 RepID=UPI0025472CD5|nr:uncharacterized protein N7457_002647 [Penicillium paradoxum]KAJ5787657.1 hypothetical protein N7457_002647 [Penicillium paradoxum]
MDDDEGYLADESSVGKEDAMGSVCLTLHLTRCVAQDIRSLVPLIIVSQFPPELELLTHKPFDSPYSHYRLTP